LKLCAGWAQGPKNHYLHQWVLHEKFYLEKKF